MIIRVSGWSDVYIPSHEQAEEFAAALCVGLCSDVQVFTNDGKLEHEFFKQCV
jgi:hypothetical protein